MNDIMREFKEDKDLVELQIRKHAESITFWEGIKRDTDSFYKTDTANRMIKRNRKEMDELTKLLEQANKVPGDI